MGDGGNRMKSRSYLHPVHLLWQLATIALVLMALLLISVTKINALTADGGYEVVGTVTNAPASSDGVGLWRIVDDKGHSRTAEANADTEFENGLPKIGDRVEIETDGGGLQPIANSIKKLSEDDDGDHGGDDKGKIEIEGTVLQRPADAKGIGVWLIQTQLFLTQTVIADANTKFDQGIPEIGVWIEAEGPRQPDGAIRATRIRPDEYDDGELVVWLEAGVSPSTIETRYELEAKSALLASANIYLFATEDDDEPGLVNRIRKDSDVVWAELNYVHGVPEKNAYITWSWGGVEPSGYINQYAYSQINLANAQRKYNGDGVVIAVLDTGVALNHPQLADHLLQGWDFVSDDAIPEDEPAGLAWGHGTHVAGLIAYMAPDAKILPMRVLDSNGVGNTFLLAYAINWATQQGVDVINLSLGADVDSLFVHETIKQAVANDIIVVAAAGNNNVDTAIYPAGYDETLAVAAVDSGSSKAEFSNYGTWIDFATPGIGITSTVTGPYGLGYASWTGTSMATPFVSGAVALVLQANPLLSGAMIIDRLASTATDIDTINPAFNGKLGTLPNIGVAVMDYNHLEATERLFLPTIRHGETSWFSN
jgi:thermitase